MKYIKNLKNDDVIPALHIVRMAIYLMCTSEIVCLWMCVRMGEYEALIFQHFEWPKGRKAINAVDLLFPSHSLGFWPAVLN